MGSFWTFYDVAVSVFSHYDSCAKYLAKSGQGHLADVLLNGGGESDSFEKSCRAVYLLFHGCLCNRVIGELLKLFRRKLRSYYINAGVKFLRTTNTH